MTIIIALNSDQEIALTLAQWVAEQRLSQNLSQKDVYQTAGISKSTYKKFEQTGEISVVRLIAVFRAIGKLDKLENILNTKPAISPMDKLMGKTTTRIRKRASKKQ